MQTAGRVRSGRKYSDKHTLFRYECIWFERRGVGDLLALRVFQGEAWRDKRHPNATHLYAVPADTQPNAGGPKPEPERCLRAVRATRIATPGHAARLRAEPQGPRRRPPGHPAQGRVVLRSLPLCKILASAVGQRIVHELPFQTANDLNIDMICG